MLSKKTRIITAYKAYTEGRSGKRLRFTLIEMLVVIAIIGILAAMLMPSLQGAIDTSRQTMCAANFRQIGFMFGMYSDDHHGWWPPVDMRRDTNYNATNYYPYGMVHGLGAYMNHPEWAEISSSGSIHSFSNADKAEFRESVFVCPEYPRGKMTSPWIIPYESGVAESKYAITDYGKTKLPAPAGKSNSTYANFRRSTASSGPYSRRIHLADSCRVNLGDRGGSNGFLYEKISTPNFAIRRHQDGANMMFMDNHVEWAQGDIIKLEVNNSFILNH